MTNVTQDPFAKTIAGLDRPSTLFEMRTAELSGCGENVRTHVALEALDTPLGHSRPNGNLTIACHARLLSSKPVPPGNGHPRRHEGYGASADSSQYQNRA